MHERIANLAAEILSSYPSAKLAAANYEHDPRVRELIGLRYVHGKWNWTMRLGAVVVAIGIIGAGFLAWTGHWVLGLLLLVIAWSVGNSTVRRGCVTDLFRSSSPSAEFKIDKQEVRLCRVLGSLIEEPLDGEAQRTVCGSVVYPIEPSKLAFEVACLRLTALDFRLHHLLGTEPTRSRLIEGVVSELKIASEVDQAVFLGLAYEKSLRYYQGIGTAMQASWPSELEQLQGLADEVGPIFAEGCGFPSVQMLAALGADEFVSATHRVRAVLAESGIGSVDGP